jgi:uncharacterized DUF497 family protein
MNFEWDSNKNRRNALIHGIDFETAIQVFEDVDGFELYDEEHSTLKEDRWRRIGKIRNGKIYLVVYTEIEKTNTIRIITAFTDSKIKRAYYERQKNKNK